MQALNGRMMYFGCRDGRFNLVYPFFGNALIGSTDLPQADADEARTTSEETDYLLAAVSEVFPDIKLTRADVILTYCGVRPLPRANGKDIGDVSRDHSIGRDTLPGTEVPVLSLIGGKWTTFRAFSEQASEAVLALLGKSRQVSTMDRAIGGGRNYPMTPADVAAFTNTLAPLSPARAASLFERYGTRASALATVDETGFTSLPGYSRGELAVICANENVRRLADLLLRRTAIAMEGLLSEAVIAETAPLAAEVLGWDAKRTAEEIEHAKAELRKRSVATVTA
jgi:glycerol-3-phosphate dehydrogenase